MKPKAIFNWSGGKDSSLALHRVLEKGELDIMCLLTSVSREYQRITMHGVRVELLEEQANSIGLPLVKLELPEVPDMSAYETAMREVLEPLKSQGAEFSVFGDIFLEDLRKYREENLARIGLKALFPIWNLSTRALMMEFIQLGFKAVITTVNEKYLDKSFAGRMIDDDFLKDLPPDVDPCGENGEYHSFVFDGPIFRRPVKFKRGEVIYRKYESPTASAGSDDPYSHGFWFCDLVPG